MISILREHYSQVPVLFMHIKETDVAGEDGNFEEKTRAIESEIRIVPRHLVLRAQVPCCYGRPFDPRDAEGP